MKAISILSLSSLALGAPLLNSEAKRAEPGKYLVVMKPEETADGATIMKGILGAAADEARTAQNIYENFKIGSFSGFAAALDDAQLEAVKADSRVAYLEPDGLAHTMIVEERQIEGAAQAITTQSNAVWGLTRISHKVRGSTSYVYDSSAGSGTCSYVIDTGIQPALAEFEGRATMVKSYYSSSVDDNGHGTHVAGTIGSKTYGVAKKTKLYGIKVLDASGSGSWSNIISGIQYAINDSKTRSCPKGVFANMSLGGSKSQAVNDAATAMINAGIFLAVAAGNENSDYRDSSPASASGVFAVAASDSSDVFASFSNYGPGMGVIAPGVAVQSTYYDGSIQSLSGTSMATPHVVGLAAYLAGLSSSKLSVSALKSQIQSLSTKNAVSLRSAASQTPNYLAFNGAS